jgi:hypothetical protein
MMIIVSTCFDLVAAGFSLRLSGGAGVTARRVGCALRTTLF